MTPSSRKISKRKPAPKRALVLSSLALLGAALCLNPSAVFSAAEVPFLVSAYKAAEKNPENPGIGVTVTLTALGANSKPPKMMVAQGALAMEGDLLGGRLPMTLDNPSPFEKDRHKLFFNVSKTGRIGLQWLVDDKPFQGKPMQSFDTDAAGSTLTKKINWNGGLRQVTVSLERKLTFIPGVIKLRPTATPKPIIIGGGVIKFKPTPTPTPKMIFIPGKIKLKPKGRNVKVMARLLVTNSDDGVGGIFGNSDKSVELGGGVSMGGQRIFDFNGRSAQEGTEIEKIIHVKLTYSDPEHRFFKVSGSIWDKDTASASDTMWISSQSLDLIKIMESNAEYLIKGDRKSESADLYIRVTDEGEFN
ncbi:hypothetical protein EON80_11045 [bacterium]|nr:MAG: hypothetical protein EON80_11045 [bacterium]